MTLSLAPGSKSIWRADPPAILRQWAEGVLARADALDFLRALAPDIADVVFLDPPFNLGKQYGGSEKKRDLRPSADYERFISEVLTECIRVMKPGSALFLYHIPHWAMKFGAILDSQLLFRHWIAISMKNGFARGNRLYPAHYALLYFTKGAPSSFRRPKMPPQKCPHCGEYIRDYGGYMQFVQGGVNLTDIWDDLSPVRHKTRKNRIANELPLELVRRAVRITGRRGSVLIDPFVGSGTALVAAAEFRMRFVASDLDRSAYAAAARRYSKYLKNTSNLKSNIRS